MKRFGGACAALALLAPSAAWAQEGPGALDIFRDWQISGSSSTTVEAYQDFNNVAQSPFPDRGTFGQSDLSLNFQRRFSPFNVVKGQFFGTAVNNPYRSGFIGLVPERFNLNWENGETRVPFRLDVGDVFAFTTTRTLQRSLKGAQIELQPVTGGNGRHSFLLFSGTNQQFYRKLDFDNDVTFGGSWLFNHAEHGNLSANAVVNRLDAGANGVAAQRTQTVLSLAGDTILNWRGQTLEFTAEAGYFFGDDAGGVAPDENGIGLFAEMRGKSGKLPLDYSLTFSQFDENYRPAGAAVTSDQRSLAHRGGWRFAGGRNLRWRAQWDRNNFDNANSTDTLSAGLSFSGPFDLGGAQPFNISSDYGFTGTFDQNKTVATRNHTFSLNGTTSLNARTSARAGYSFQSLDNQGQIAVYTNTLTFGLDRQVAFSGFSGSLSPSLTLRDTAGGNAAGEEISASLAANLTRDAWSLQSSYRLARQIRDTAGASTLTQALNARADWSSGPHSFGVELDYSILDRQAQATGEPFKISAVYTYSFDKPAGRGFGDPAAPGGTFEATPIADTGGGGAFDIMALLPNSEFEDVLRQVSEAGFAGGQTVLEGLVVYETQVYSAIDLRQRLVLQHQGRRHRTAAVIFDPADPRNGAALEADFQRVLSEIIRLYGPPEITFDRGDFTGDVARDIGNSDLIRLAEWRTDGGTLRLGIPRRLDGQIRIELHHSRSFRPPNHTLWSLNEVQ